jgi:ABC-type nickel/cobalt efflux system permease component RcnA
VAVGFLHAFTPGHGKALVGAFLIANQGKAVHALCLGLVITLAHTLSIYCFGLLASTAARFFLPGEFIPVLSLLCGLFITGLGISVLCRRFAGRAADHAHLLPNLRLLKRETVNILIDGEAAEANEAFLIACDDQGVQESLKAAGAEDFNLCSPGCSAHGWLPPALRLRQRAGYFKTALKTGAVDAVVLSSEKAARRLDRVRGGTPVEPYRGDETRPREILFQAIRNYSRRDREGRSAGKAPPPAEERLSWGKVISLGISGGIIPCPDALAVLLAAIAMGKLALGMGIILFFSMGLALALILVGMIIVFTRKALSGRRRMAGLAALLPYGSALFIGVLGILMAAGAARDLFRIG